MGQSDRASPRLAWSDTFCLVVRFFFQAVRITTATVCTTQIYYLFRWVGVLGRRKEDA